MNESVLKALKLLDFFIEEPELTLRDLARLSGMPKPTVYRFLAALEKYHFVKKIKYSELDIRYKLGTKLLELGNVVAEQLELRKVALPHMQRLGNEVEEVVHLTIREGNEAVYIEKVESKKALRLFIRVGKRAPLHAGSGPKLLLAFTPEEEFQQIISHYPLESLTKNTITEKRKLLEEMKKIRADGFAVSEGEQDEDTVGISFPVRDYTGNVIAALGVSGLKYAFREPRLTEIKERVRVAAEQISKELGFIH
ncbi:IclR family transcriptional regulator [Kyrpidia sp.]|uniref:IclR family transcriptional regulator n=1 Tax=Kyrpidia sp. TaxID=2073077 RepID=UPI0025887B52|nr:IclR family transcriptional regulator [Kyrpidia sp.]MCL6576134.1 IclR family transcriptional regulator [Kyrpidia sp.]